MKFSEIIYTKAEAELKRRREQAEKLAALRRKELTEKYPQLTEIENTMRNAALEVIKSIGSGSNSGANVGQLAVKNLQAQEERKKLIAAAGYPADYLDPPYTCKKCKDTGILDGKLCECHLALLQQISVSELSCSPLLASSTFETFDLKYYSTEKDYETGFSPRAVMELTRDTLKDYAECFTPASESWVFCGGTGLGKTHLALAVLNRVTQRGYSVYYNTAASIVKQLEKAHFGRGDSDIEDELEKCDLLIIDDLGTEFKTSFSESAINEIVNDAILNGKAMIIISNFSFGELEERYGQRLVSRLNGFKVAGFVGEDIRQLKG